MAVLICAAFVVTACKPGSDQPAGSGAVDSAAVKAVANGLPDDPAQAAEQLVAEIHSGDGKRSAAATAELLRRAGHPIVSAKGPVVALPDKVALFDAPIYAELVPLLAEATRAGDRYTVDQFATLLTAVGLTPKQATFAQLMATFGGWGKGERDNSIFVTAGTAVRALSAQRQQVLFAGADPETVHLDPLQTVLLLSHATSRLVEVTGQVKSHAMGRPGVLDRLVGGGVAHAAPAKPAGPCGELAALIGTPPDQVSKAITDIGVGQLKDGLAQELLSEAGKETFDKANEAWGKAGATVSAIMLMLGARLDLTADKNSTHFKHRAGSRDEHVLLTATARFDLKIALDKLECYALAGVDIPKPGPLKDLTVRWDSYQAQAGTFKEGGAQLLQAVSADSTKITRGSKTGDDGTATLELKPMVEDPADKGAKLKGKATYIAELDRESFPFELGDVYALLSNPVGFGIGKTFDLLREVLTKAGLPSQAITIEVEFHGVDVILAQGENEVNLIMAKLPRVYVDLVSCAGLTGPFKGTAGYDGAKSGQLLQMAGAATGVHVPKDFAGKDNEISVMPNDRIGPNPFFIMKGEGGNQFLDGVIDLYPHMFLNNALVLYGNWQVGRPVGHVEILLAGHRFPFSNLRWPVMRVAEDPRCPKARYFHDGT